MQINKLSIVVPAYNEGKTIQLVLKNVVELTLVNNIEKELIIVNDCPRTRVDVTGITTVCVVDPVKYCCWALATVNVVVPAAVAVVVYPSMIALADILALASRDTRLDAVAAVL